MEPYLVQRLLKNERPRETNKGVDQFFEMDYMGAAEFEYGALPKALKEMRCLGDLKPVRIQIEAEIQNRQTGYWEKIAPEFWFVGPDNLIPVAREFIKDQLTKQKTRLKEGTRIKQRYTDKIPYYNKFVGWWCVDEKLSFAFFCTQQDAKNWCKGLRQTA